MLDASVSAIEEQPRELPSIVPSLEFQRSRRHLRCRCGFTCFQGSLDTGAGIEEAGRPMEIKSGRDLPGRVRAPADRGSRVDPGVLEQGMARVPGECAICIRLGRACPAWI